MVERVADQTKALVLGRDRGRVDRIVDPLHAPRVARLRPPKRGFVGVEVGEAHGRLHAVAIELAEDDLERPAAARAHVEHLGRADALHGGREALDERRVGRRRQLAEEAQVVLHVRAHARGEPGEVLEFDQVEAVHAGQSTARRTIDTACGSAPRLHARAIEPVARACERAPTG